MFQKKSAAEYKPAIDKIEMKTLVHGEKTLLVEFRMKEGALLPRHSHPHEQTGYLVSGSMDLIIGNETFTVEPGDSWCISGNIEHNAVILEDTVAVEVFSPVRDDYLPQQVQ
ncbi:MAG: cupin domain-containing protein [Desulfuromusa sp.]|nr:cupin domain-containing protein [Desulfuromusa sp.]